MSTNEDRTGGDLREGYAEVGDIRLQYVEAGEGPLIVLLHGFPEFWYGWRLQLNPLAAAGFRVVAPDLRGDNLSSRPDGVAADDIGQLTADIRGLVHERGAESALLAGHDWGGTVAWATAMHHPEVVDRLAILNAAHRGSSRRGCTTRASSAGPGSSSSSPSRSCPKASSTPTTGISSGTFCATPTRRIRRRRSTATSRRGRSRGRQPR
jgi:pimeloyl-ACP methyl ester carboxylesterase